MNSLHYFFLKLEIATDIENGRICLFFLLLRTDEEESSTANYNVRHSSIPGRMLTIFCVSIP